MEYIQISREMSALEKTSIEVLSVLAKSYKLRNKDPIIRLEDGRIWLNGFRYNLDEESIKELIKSGYLEAKETNEIIPTQKGRETMDLINVFNDNTEVKIPIESE